MPANVYEPPSIVRMGSLADLTRGGDPDNLGDGAAFRGPRVSTPPVGGPPTS